VQRYVVTNAPDEVNIPGVLKEQIVAALEREPNLDMFDGACRHLYDMLQRDYLTYWMSSPQNARMLLRLSHSDLLTNTARLLCLAPGTTLEHREVAEGRADETPGDRLRSPDSRAKRVVLVDDVGGATGGGRGGSRISARTADSDAK
jgi:hypothetical protein